MKRFNKKSALGITMSAIVYIVLAMALIGVGAFIINTVIKGAGNLVEIRPMRGIEPSSDNPIIGPSENIEFDLTKRNRVGFYVLNKFSDERTISITEVYCVKDGTDVILPGVTTSSITLNPGQKENIYIIIDPTVLEGWESVFTSGNIVSCKATFNFETDEIQKSFLLNVK